MFEFMKEKKVLSTKDPDLCRLADDTLKEAGIATHVWESEEQPACGCGAKIDIRRVARKDHAMHPIHHISVSRKDAARAAKIIAALSKASS